jgi:hypothetical protein
VNVTGQQRLLIPPGHKPAFEGARFMFLWKHLKSILISNVFVIQIYKSDISSEISHL